MVYCAKIIQEKVLKNEMFLHTAKNEIKMCRKIFISYSICFILG